VSWTAWGGEVNQLLTAVPRMSLAGRQESCRRYPATAALDATPAPTGGNCDLVQAGDLDRSPLTGGLCEAGREFSSGLAGSGRPVISAGQRVIVQYPGFEVTGDYYVCVTAFGTPVADRLAAVLTLSNETHLRRSHARKEGHDVNAA
jgi:hypothetical protein